MFGTKLAIVSRTDSFPFVFQLYSVTQIQEICEVFIMRLNFGQEGQQPHTFSVLSFNEVIDRTLSNVLKVQLQFPGQFAQPFLVVTVTLLNRIQRSQDSLANSIELGLDVSDISIACLEIIGLVQ